MSSTDISTGVHLRTKLLAGLVFIAVGVFGLGLAALGYLQAQPNQATSRSSTQLTGILRTAEYDATASGASEEYYLEMDDQHPHLTWPANLPAPKSGSSVTVTGQTTDGSSFAVQAVTTAETVPAPAPKKTSTMSTSSVANADYKVLVVMGYYPGQSVPTTPTASDAQAVMFGPAPSVSDFYNDNSFGHVHMTGAVIDWVPFASPETTDVWANASMALQAVRVAQPDLDLHQFQHLVIISPYTNPTAPDGYSMIGKIHVATPDGYQYMGVEMLRSTVVTLPRSVPLLPYTAIHEFGHGLGLMHAGLLGCTDMVIDPSCRISEYGDRFDVMGGAYELPGAEDLNAIHLTELGWLDDSNVASVNTYLGGVYTLEPIENRTTGLKVLAIPRSTTDMLYVEYRQPIGYDTTLDDPTVFTGALLHTYDTGVYANSYGTWSDSLLLDPTPPALYKDNALQVGDSFTDPATGVVVSVLSQDANGITVRVSPGNHPIYADMTMLEPENGGQYTGPTVSFGGMASSPYGIDHVEWYLVGADRPFATSSTPPYYDADLDVTGYADGSTIQAYMLAVDAIGTRTSTAPYSFHVSHTNLDTTPPTIQVTSPTEAAVINPSVTITASISDNHDLSYARFYLDCPDSQPLQYCAYTNLSSPYTMTRTLSAGKHTLRVTAGDGSGNVTTAPTVHFIVDVLNPSITPIYPLSGQTVSSVFNFSFFPYDDYGIDHAVVYVDGVRLADLSRSPFAVAWDSRKAADGAHTWYVATTDLVGKTSTSNQMTFTVRNSTTAPPVTATIPTPSVALVGTAGGALSGQNGIFRLDSDPKYITKAVFTVDGKMMVTKSSPPFAIGIDSPAYLNGAHAFSVTLTMTNNQVVTRTFTVIIKNNPTISISTPAKNSTVKKTITLSPRVRGGAGTAKIEYLLDGKRMVMKRAAPFSYTWNTKTAKTGWHTLTIRVTDKQGKVAGTSVRLKIAR